MNARIKTFLLEPTEECWASLRRYQGDSKCPGKMGYHKAHFNLGEMAKGLDLDGSRSNPFDQFPKEDERWPKRCECGYEFVDGDNWQLFTDLIWVRKDTGEKVSLRNPPAGAIYRCTWYEECGYAVGFDGQSWCCVLPDGHVWSIDGTASNCTRKGDKTHRCWIRKGTAPDFDVGKDGETCSAGAGSILTKEWHGFLRNGYLEQC